jgi:hypothetical protein
VSQGHEAEPTGWSDLERRFFEAAPPDVPIAPAPAVTFEDLEMDLETPPRARRLRLDRRARPRRPAPAWAETDRAIVRSVTRWVENLERALRPAVARAGTWARAWTGTTSTVGVGRMRPAFQRAREVATRTLGLMIARIAAELPGERPEGRTIVAGLVTLVVVLGLSASVLGSRGGPWLAPPAATPGAGSIANGAPAPDLKCPATLAPAPVAFVQPLEPELRRHVVASPAKRARHARRHAAHQAPTSR